MNKEDYVSLEVAKLLKEKGFDLKCNHYWGQSKDKTILDFEGFNFTKEWIEVNNNFYDAVWLAPTLYEAQKWLRINHKINISVFFYSKGLGYGATLRNIENGTDIGEKVELCDDYEEALNAGILEALKLI